LSISYSARGGLYGVTLLRVTIERSDGMHDHLAFAICCSLERYESRFRCDLALIHGS
jgi:hypothetical protein